MRERGDRGADRAALRDERHRSRLEIGPVKHLADRRHRFVPQIDDTDRVGTDETDALAVGKLDELALQAHALRARLGVVRRQHQRKADLTRRRVLEQRRNAFGGDRGDHQVDRPADARERRVAFATHHFAELGVDGVDVAVVRELAQELQRKRAELARIVRSARDRDAARA